LTTYYDEIYEICKWNKFDVLGHLTYTLRYMTGVQGHIVNMEQNGKGIEINTSGLRQQYGFTFPTLEYVKMFKECGGEVLSIGSDSHCAADLGKGIVEGTEIAKQSGFKYLTYFKNRKPNFIKI